MTLLSQVEIKLEDVEVLHLFILHLAGYDEYVKRTNEMFTLVNIERNLSKQSYHVSEALSELVSESPERRNSESKFGMTNHVICTICKT